MPKLVSLEAWMMKVITHPEGVLRGADSSDARSILDVRSDELDQLIIDTRGWAASARLGIYWNAYYARLQECLRDEYPVLVETIGQDAFDEFANDYLQSFPPTSYTLGALGAQFPEYLDANRPEREGQLGEPDWIDFLIDLSRFEWLINKVFDGPGAEEVVVLSSNDFASHVADQADSLVFQCVPCLHLCAFRFPVPSYHADMKSGQKVEAPIREMTYVAVTRLDYTVKHFSLTKAEFALLSLLQQGMQLGDAIQSVCESSEEDSIAIAANIAEWFSTWTRRGFF